MKIFILSPNANTLFSKKLLARLHSVGDLQIVKKPQPFEKVKKLYSGNEERILAIDPDFCDWKVPNKIIDMIPNLKAVVLQTTSFSWIDSEYIGKKKIPVVNLRGFSSLAVAEWAVMMAMNVARKIPLIIKDKWKYDYSKHQGIELKGKTAGIVGMGNIGTRIAEICKGLDMNVVYWSKNSRDKRFKYLNLASLMRNADVIFPAMAQNDRTKGLISDGMLKSMKKSAIFVSIVHHVYNDKLLLDMAKKGEIYGYAFEESKPSMFGKHPGNVWDGPQLAWTTDGSMKRNAEQWVEAIVKAAKGKYPTRVN